MRKINYKYILEKYLDMKLKKKKLNLKNGSIDNLLLVIEKQNFLVNFLQFIFTFKTKAKSFVV